MTLLDTIYTLKNIALKQPNIRTAVEGNIYELMNSNPSLEYGVFVITQEAHTSDEGFNNFTFNLFYVDRLVNNLEDNRLQIQSIGIEVLNNIISTFCNVTGCDSTYPTFNVFTQKFKDECSGVYCRITFDVEKEIYCAEEY